MKKLNEKQTILIIIGFIGIVTIALFWNTCNLPMLGDALIHMDDTTYFGSFEKILQPFYSLKGIKGNPNSPVMNFHRPIFDEYIVMGVKKIFHNNTVLIRFVSLLVLAGTNICSFIIGYLVSGGEKINGIVCFLMSTFSYAHFFPLIDWGLSFSLWLSFSGYIAFIFLYQYERTEKKIFSILSIIFTFFATYVKESAMVLSVALCFHFLIYTLMKYKKINRKLVMYCAIQFIVFASYFVTRLIKLGNFFDAATVGGGTEGYTITFSSIVQKIYDYFLYSFNIPTSGFYDYMVVNISNINYIIATMLVVTAILILRICVLRYNSNPSVRLNVITGIGMFVILIMPCITVERNALYYNDLALLGILLLIASADLRIHKCISYSFVIAYILAFVLGVQKMYLSNTNYLIKGEYQFKKVRDELREYDYPINKHVVQMSSFDSNNEIHWYTNNINVGSFFKYNINGQTKIINVDDTLKYLDLYKETYIEFWNTLGDYYNPLVIVLNNVTAEQYDVLRMTPTDGLNGLYLQLYFNGQTYDRYIDIPYYTQNGNHKNIYIIIPKESELIYDTTSVTELNFIREK